MSLKFVIIIKKVIENKNIIEIKKMVYLYLNPIKIRETEAETILNNDESSGFLILFVLPFLESPHSCFNFSLCFSYRFLLLDTNTIGTSLTNKYY